MGPIKYKEIYVAQYSSGTHNALDAVVLRDVKTCIVIKQKCPGGLNDQDFQLTSEEHEVITKGQTRRTIFLYGLQEYSRRRRRRGNVP